MTNKHITSYCLENNSSLYFGKGQILSSTICSNLSASYLIISKNGKTLLQYANAFLTGSLIKLAFFRSTIISKTFCLIVLTLFEISLVISLAVYDNSLIKTPNKPAPTGSCQYPSNRKLLWHGVRRYRRHLVPRLHHGLFGHCHP